MNRRACISLLGAAALTPRTANGRQQLCGLPVNPLITSGVSTPFPIEQARDFDVPAGEGERPLWSEMSAKERSDALGFLKTAYAAMIGAGTAGHGLLMQAWIHDLYCAPDGKPAMNAPSIGVDMHANLLFLPWHRAFLFFHERLLQANLPENPGFRLPVYDWENDLGQDLPLSYGALPMFQGNYCTNVPRKGLDSTVSAAVMQGWLHSEAVADFAGATAHGGNSASGPHQSVHHTLGGLMTSMQTSAADPVFYAHHANVDRYWDYWHQFYSRATWFKRDYLASWPGGYFYFYDRGAKPVRISIRQMLEPRQLGYRYKCPTVLKAFEPFKLTFPLTSQHSATQLQTLLARLDQAFPGGSSMKTVPMQVSGRPSKPIQANVSYILAIQESSSNSSHAEPVGSFSVLHVMPRAMGHKPDEIIAMCELSQQALSMIRKVVSGQSSPVRLVYGTKNSESGQIFNPRPFLTTKFQVLLEPNTP